MIFLILSYLPSLLCGVHVVRSGREMYWLWILAIAPILGPAIYVLAILLPELLGGRTARTMGAAARRALDPERELREAHRALEDAETVANRIRVARAAAALDRWQEAETQWRHSAHGHFAHDPTVLLGHATALLELGRYEEALKRLEELKALGREGDTPQTSLAFARVYEGLGRFGEADAPYRFAADRVPGLEAGARYVAFLAKAGRRADAQIGLGEIDRRLAKISPPLRAEARRWRDLAAQAVAGA